MGKFLRLKDTSQYRQALSSNTPINNESSKLRLNLTNSIYDEIKNIVANKGYIDIYSSLDLSSAPSPVSFNFKLKELYVENYRSIDKYTLNFDEISGKVINVSGLNGSGKSSLMHALRDVLIGSRYINKNNRKVSEDKSLNCLIRLSLIYNDKLYFITRGAGVTTFAVDDPDNLVTKANKKELEDYIMQELPFIKYISYFILEANQHFFDSVDRTALIKTCFNLEIFDHILKLSNDMYNVEHNKLDEINQDILRNQDYQKRLNDDIELDKVKLSEFDAVIQLPKNDKGEVITVSDIQSKVDEATKYYDMANNEYNNMVRFNTSINSLRDQLGKIASLNKEEIEFNLKVLNSYDILVNDLNEVTRTFNANKSILELKTRQLESLKDTSTYCPHCNKVLAKDEHYEEARNILIKEVQDITAIVASDTANLDNVTKLYQEFLDKYGDIKSNGKYKTKNEYLSDLQSIENSANINIEIDKLNADLINSKNNYDRYALMLSQITSGVKYNEFLGNMTKLIMDINSRNELINNITRNQNKYVECDNNITRLNEVLLTHKVTLNRILDFKSLFDQKNLNSIPYSIIDMILKSMNTNELRFSSTKELASGDERFEVNCSCNISNNPELPKWINYDSMSHGQKVIADLFILEHIINLLGNVGVLIMDESLANLDQIKYANAKQFFDNTICDKILIASHNPNLDGIEYWIHFELDNDGVSKICEGAN